MARQTRRALLGTVGTTLAVGLAGCGGGGSNDDGGTTDGGSTGGIYGDSSGGGATESGGSGATDVPEAVDSYLQDANGYDGTIVDATGEDAVTVTVGGGGFAFDPVAVRIGAGATVNWEWQGGSHNVVSAEESASDFDSGDPTSDTDTTFSQSFDNTGVQLYYCEVHRSSGMLGAVDVV
ncbi:MAG: halocyanin domain-containing protein [Haloarculaceae archaeon]